VLVTHKPELLALVDRIIVIANHQIVMDGDKKNVLDKLSIMQVSNFLLASLIFICHHVRMLNQQSAS